MGASSRTASVFCLVTLGFVPELSAAESSAAESPAPLSARRSDESTSLYNLPWNGPAVKLGGHVVLGHTDRIGGNVDVGVSQFVQRHFDVGVGVQLLGLWAGGDIFDVYPERSYLDLTVLPRLVLGYGRNDGIWRFQVFAGYGLTRMQATGGAPPLPRVERTLWSHAYGFGISYGVLHFEAQWLGYMRRAEEGYFIILGQGEATESGSTGTSIALGVMFPIPLMAP
jgi:hypothetical protein